MRPARARWNVPKVLSVALLGASASACNGGSNTPDVVDVLADNAVDVAVDATMDTALDADAYAPPDCSFTCMTEYFPGPDGSIEQIVFYADGASSTDATCDAPPLPIQCGV
jgi:hypothetical protein